MIDFCNVRAFLPRKYLLGNHDQAGRAGDDYSEACRQVALLATDLCDTEITRRAHVASFPRVLLVSGERTLAVKTRTNPLDTPWTEPGRISEKHGHGRQTGKVTSFPPSMGYV